MSRGKVAGFLRFSSAFAVLLVLFVARFDVALSTLLRDRNFSGYSPKDNAPVISASNKPVDYRTYLSNKWKSVLKEQEAPVIEIQLLKGHVLPDESTGIKTEYVYSPKDYKKDDVQTEEDAKQEKIRALYAEYQRKLYEILKKERGNSTSDDQILPYIGSRNIITAPSYCPKGQRKDNRGRCKTIVSTS